MQNGSPTTAESIARLLARLNINKGWIRVWIVAAVIWVVVFGTRDVLLMEEREAARQQSYVSHGEYIGRTPEIMSAERFENIGRAALIFGPPVIVPLILISIVALEKWIKAGFNEPPSSN